ncbi:MAG TPA: iron-containing alcohol dehydrogenase, partial [Pyrodictium sp.]|nr:iron-containing alcohol dehydrogenase [Pyrodictium sp.]
HSIKARTPIAIIADIKIIAKAPHRLLVAGAGDLIAKLTAVRDWRLAHRLKGEYYGEYAASLALLSAKHVIKYASIIRHGGEEAARIVVEGLISSGVAMCIAGSTRPASGSEHLFSHALDLLAPKPALHGEQVALGTIMMMYLHGGNWRAVRATMKRLGLPVTAKELGIEDSIIIKALTIAHKIRPERYTILGETGLTWEAAEKLARVTKVIE